jgi:hypothetical protein
MEHPIKMNNLGVPTGYRKPPYRQLRMPFFARLDPNTFQKECQMDWLKGTSTGNTGTLYAQI